MVVATHAVSAHSAALKASLSPRCLRWTNRATATPPACAATRWLGWASTRPAASTRSLMEKVCESFFTCTCTGKASLIAKAAAQSTHGRFRAVGAPGSVRTTMTNSATATAASAVVISMIRWGTFSPNARGAVPGAPFVIVVTSLWVQDRQAQSFPDHVTPDQVTPDHVTPDQVTPDHVTPDQVTPDQVTPDQVTPDQVTPARSTSALSATAARCAGGRSAIAPACSAAGRSAITSASWSAWSRTISVTPA